MNEYEKISASFKRCDESGAFSDTFYEIFISKSDDVSLFFKDTDFGKQKKLLRATVKILVTKNPNEPKTKKILNDISRTHNRNGYNIAPKYYKLWLDSLCETLARHDPNFTDELEQTWRRLMQYSIDIIIAGYNT